MKMNLISNTVVRMVTKIVVGTYHLLLLAFASLVLSTHTSESPPKPQHAG